MVTVGHAAEQPDDGLRCLLRRRGADGGRPARGGARFGRRVAPLPRRERRETELHFIALVGGAPALFRAPAATGRTRHAGR